MKMYKIKKDFLFSYAENHRLKPMVECAGEWKGITAQRGGTASEEFRSNSRETPGACPEQSRRISPGSFILLLSFLLLLQAGCISLRQADKTVCQFSSMDAFQSGAYQGWVKYGSIAKSGDFGIGTVDRLDGEMIALDGRFYRIKSDGSVNVISPGTLSPFATVTFFKPDRDFTAGQFSDYAGLAAFLDGILPDKEALYAIRVDGDFLLMKTRSPRAQSKPYPALEEALRGQSVFLLKDVTGSMVGFRFPESCRGVNKPGYHFHFLSGDKHSGGHVLELSFSGGKVRVSRIYNLSLKIPVSK
ncbi:MAG: acetolactate decarboxylase [Candidatus Omnitrophota bacterium]